MTSFFRTAAEITMPATVHPLRPRDNRAIQLHEVDDAWRCWMREAPHGCRQEWEAEANKLDMLAADLVHQLKRAAALDASKTRSPNLSHMGDVMAEAFAEGLKPEAARLFTALFVAERDKP